MVSKAHLEALRAARPSHNAELHLRPEGATVAYVHSSIEAERIGQLNRGDKAMNLAEQKLKADLNKVRQEGFHRAQFNRLSHTNVFNP